ncbi:MAG: cytochrome oxidase small assembly protein [Betaproteobacteria bacterium]|nr:cytochrome oxidase small assembly protein [Betaproteobacteria bacterium]
MSAHYPAEDTARRNRRTALILALVAAAFMIGFVLKIWLK